MSDGLPNQDPSLTLPARTIPPRLLAWFDRHQRPLAWRRDRDPYRVWVSEVMLQQTTVAAVGPYFERFLIAFPTVEALAAAPEADVLRLWSGLGYYRRARHLHAAAKRLAEAKAAGGAWPDTPVFWAELPGVGRYILGAVLSQAFEARLPIVEANSVRVLSRLYGYRGDPRKGAGQKWAWNAAEELLPDARVGDFNQALMELGATVCTVTAPRCRECPVRADCRAFAAGEQESIPPRPERKAITEVAEVAAAVRDAAGRLLLAQRPPTAKRWAGFWEVPHAELRPGEGVAAGAERAVRELTGLEATAGPELLTVRHGVTRWSITMRVIAAMPAGGELVVGNYAAFAWVDPATAGDYPVSSPQRKLIAGLLERSLFG